MREQLVIEGETLTATADAIREMRHTEAAINPLDFPEEILKIDLTTEEYMCIFDLSEYPENITDIHYTAEEIARIDDFIEFYSETEVDTNGE